MYYGESVSASIYKRYTHKSTETADVNTILRALRDPSVSYLSKIIE